MKILADRRIEDTEKIDSDLNDVVAPMKVTRLTTEHDATSRMGGVAEVVSLPLAGRVGRAKRRPGWG